MKMCFFVLSLLSSALLGFGFVRFGVRDRDPITFFFGLLILVLVFLGALLGVLFSRLSF